MSTVYPNRQHPRGGAGCPPVLATDVSHNDVVEPPVEWPPAPPTRRRGAHVSARSAEQVIDVTDDALDGDPAADATVAQLTAGRAVRLLDTAIEHMRTVLETSPDAATAARVERAIGDVSRAFQDLQGLTNTTGPRP